MKLSPAHKKILLLLGAAVGGFVVYKKFIAKPAVAPKLAAAQLAQVKSNAVIKMNGTDNLLEDLGLEEALGSLGGKRR